MKIEMVGFLIGVGVAAVGCLTYLWRRKQRALAEANARVYTAEALDVEKKVDGAASATDQSLKAYQDAVKAHRSAPPGVPPKPDGG